MNRFKNMMVASLLACSMPLSVSAAQSASDLLVNAAVPIDSLTAKEVKRIFLGKKTFWDDGKPIRVCYLDSDEFSDSFSQDILQRSFSQFNSYWTRKLFAGDATPPRPVTSHDEVLEFLKNNQGSVCFIGEGNTISDAAVREVSISL